MKKSKPGVFWRKPHKKMRNILITSALPYVNATPHLGNLIGSVLSADVYNRFVKQRGYNSLYVCGTDEYGTATEFKAMEEKCTPQELCDKYHSIHQEIYDWFGIEFDIFGRTSTRRQTDITTDIFTRLDQNGYIEERTIKQYYCVPCDKYLADRFVEGTCPVCKLPKARGDQCDACGEIYEAMALIDPRCKQCGVASTVRESPHLFLLLTKLVPKLRPWVEKTAGEGGWTQNTIRVSAAWLKKLEDRCITRSLKWGSPVPRPGYEDKVFYVWFDAPIGYISITASWNEYWEEWWKGDGVELHQFMGKDNIAFHTIIFPGTLIGTGENYNLAGHISTTEYLTYQGGKFSKSLRRGVFGDDAKSTGILPDVWRYYLLSNRPEVSDSSFCWDELMRKNNGELNNNLGNFIHRVLSFIDSKYAATVPSLGVLERVDEEYIEKVATDYQEYIRQLEDVKINGAIRTAMKISSDANAYFQAKEPWKNLSAAKTSCDNTLNICLQVVRLLAALVAPYMPATALDIEKMVSCLPLSLAEPTFSLFRDFGGHRIGPLKVLFQQIAPERINELKRRFEGEEKTHFPLDLIVGTIVAVDAHPSEDSLLILKISLGENFSRVIVSSIKQHYQGEDLMGQKVVVVNNIKKIRIKGVDSYAMLLCAKKDGEIRLVRQPSCEDGQRAAPLGVDGECSVAKNFNCKRDWAKLGLLVNPDGLCVYLGQILAAGGKPLEVDGGLRDCELV